MQHFMAELRVIWQWHYDLRMGLYVTVAIIKMKLHESSFWPSKQRDGHIKKKGQPGSNS